MRGRIVRTQRASSDISAVHPISWSGLGASTCHHMTSRFDFQRTTFNDVQRLLIRLISSSFSLRLRHKIAGADASGDVGRAQRDPGGSSHDDDRINGIGLHGADGSAQLSVGGCTFVSGFARGTQGFPSGAAPWPCPRWWVANDGCHGTGEVTPASKVPS